MRVVAAIAAVGLVALLVLARDLPDRETRETAPTPPPSAVQPTTTRPPADLWGFFESEPGLYERSLTRHLGTGRAITRVRRVAEGHDGSAVLFQNPRLGEHRGRRIRVEVVVRTRGADAVVLRAQPIVDDGTRFEPLAPSQTAALEGTHERHTLALDLDVPVEADELDVSVVLEGAGEIAVESWSLDAA